MEGDDSILPLACSEIISSTSLTVNYITPLTFLGISTFGELSNFCSTKGGESAVMTASPRRLDCLLVNDDDGDTVRAELFRF
jgi:hypothetical protein